MNKIEQYLGLATRAGKIISGEELVVKAVANRQVYLVILAGDASGNTRKKLQDKCKTYGTPLRSYAERNQLGHCIGKEQRVVVGIKDQGFAQELIKHIDMNEGGNV